MAQVIKIDPYNSTTGQGTLSFYANKYGVSVDQLLEANKGNSAVKSADLIQSGGQLFVPDARSVQQTDTQYRATTDENIAKISGLVAKKSTPTTTTDTTNTDKNKVDLTNTENVLKEDAKKKINQVNATLDSVAQIATQATANLIGSIKTIYAGRIAKMEEANKRLLSTKETVGLRQGRARYAPTLQEGILTDEEQAGQARIVELEGAMMQAIANAEQAQANFDLKVFNERAAEVDRIEKQLTEAIMNQHKMAVEQDKLIIEKEKEASAKEKADYDMMLKKSEQSAPSVYKTLSTITNDSDKKAFLEAYARGTGIDFDVLISDIEDYSLKTSKTKLDMENIRSQINKRVDDTTDTGDKKSKFAGGKTTENVISGITTLDDLSASDKEKVKADLRSYGFYSENPPEWFISMKKDENAGKTISVDFIKTEWKKYREQIGVM